MKVLVACEFSGVVRDAFIARGHDAISCDLLPSETPGPHHQGDVRELLGEAWDLVIAHPPCTYLANSGAVWLYRDPARWTKMIEAAVFFRDMLDANAPRVAVENPIMHRWARLIVGRLPDFYLQPWEHGHGETKRTGFWVRNVAPLIATNLVEGREGRCTMEYFGPKKDRWKRRSRTLPGVAAAMAEQWGAE